MDNKIRNHENPESTHFQVSFAETTFQSQQNYATCNLDSEHPCNGSQPPTEDISIMTQVMTAGSLAHLYGMSLGMGTLSENGLKIMMTGDEALVQDGFYIVFSPAVSESVLSDLKESSILLTDGTL